MGEYVKGGYLYMPDTGYILGMPKPNIGDFIVWETVETGKLTISEVLEQKERELVVRTTNNWSYHETIHNHQVRGVLK